MMMGATTLRDPVYIVAAVRDMILGLTATVINLTDYFNFEFKIKALKDEIAEAKKKLMASNNNKPTWQEWEDYKQDEKIKLDKIDTLVYQRDQLNLSFLYVDMGIINIYNGFMLGYGVVAEDTPTLQLKGSGDIILKSAKAKELYVTKHEVGGSPVGAIHEVMDAAKMGVKTIKTAASLVKSGVENGIESTALVEKIKARNQADNKTKDKENNSKTMDEKKRKDELDRLETILKE
jgi:hypothetical protein